MTLFQYKSFNLLFWSASKRSIALLISEIVKINIKVLHLIKTLSWIKGVSFIWLDFEKSNRVFSQVVNIVNTQYILFFNKSLFWWLITLVLINKPFSKCKPSSMVAILALFPGLHEKCRSRLIKEAKILMNLMVQKIIIDVVLQKKRKLKIRVWKYFFN